MSAHLYARDAREIRRLANNVLHHLDLYEHNISAGDSERIRFGLILNDAVRLRTVASRAFRRHHKERNWDWPREA